ncbi:hypothetical protein BpHYR1_040318 [Brachionus plicatilis]|uniref:Uncharacterized protein n=1 Tax=Brachionus plicatilis TaxID=10195 RepID=A0A3M7R8G1_BRAPC|nr:hypothetical protein BpHYR1_040318 [Brachionus plicatilis]
MNIDIKIFLIKIALNFTLHAICSVEKNINTTLFKDVLKRFLSVLKRVLRVLVKKKLLKLIEVILAEIKKNPFLFILTKLKFVFSNFLMVQKGCAHLVFTILITSSTFLLVKT